MSITTSDNGLFNSAKKLATKISEIIKELSQTKVMATVSKAAVKTFDFSIVNLGKGIKDGVKSFGSLGYAPVRNFSKPFSFYKEHGKINPFYIIGSAAGGAVALPVSLGARGIVNIFSGIYLGSMDALENQIPLRKEFRKYIVETGNYLSVPTYLLSYGITKPIDFTVKQLKDGVKLGWNVDLEGYKTLLKNEKNFAKRIPLTLATSTGFALGVTARAVKYPVSNAAEGFGKALGKTVNYLWFDKEEFFLKTLYNAEKPNLVHTAGMIPGTVVGFGLGQVFSTIGGAFYGFYNGAKAAANFSKIATPLEIIDETTAHQKVLMLPALLTYTAGTAAGFTVSLVTKPIHSVENFKKTGVLLAVPFVAPVHYGKKLLGKNNGLEVSLESSPVSSSAPSPYEYILNSEKPKQSGSSVVEQPLEHSMVSEIDNSNKNDESGQTARLAM